jgi:acetyl-CoA acetyltransferase
VQDVVIAGVGIHPFGRFDYGYRELGEYAARQCLADAMVPPEEIDHAFVANVGAEMAKGHNVLDRVARIGVPVVNIEAACASSGSALYLGAKLIEGGGADVVLCIGVEKAPRGFIASSGFDAWQIENGLGVNPLYFAIQAQELISPAAPRSQTLPTCPSRTIGTPSTTRTQCFASPSRARRCSPAVRFAHR